MEDDVASAENIISKWLDSAASPHPNFTSHYSDSPDDLRTFVTAVRNLHRTMRSTSSSSSLAHSHHLLHKSMKLLQSEFRRLLTTHSERLDSDSISSSVSTLTSSTSSLSDLDDDYSYHINDPRATVIINLRSVADCMIATGYSQECFHVYREARRTVIGDGLRRLGFVRITSAQIHKLDWESLDRRITCWIAAAGTALRALFSTERSLCDAVFTASDLIRDSCFAEIVNDPAIHFFAFPELAATKGKRTPERTFRLLDMHSSIRQLLPEIEAVFSLESTSAVRLQVRSAIVGLVDAIHAALGEFEETIHQYTSRSTVPGAGIDPLTQHAVDFLKSLAERASTFVEIFEGDPLPSSPRSLQTKVAAIDLVSVSLSCSTIHEEEWELEESPPPASAWLARLLLVLLCKVDVKAGLYRDPAASYLFLANNLRYIVGAVRGSSLSPLLGAEWAARHEEKARTFAGRFEQMAWGEMESLGHVALSDWVERFQAACRRQAGMVVVSGKVRGEVKESLMRKVWAPYRAAYEEACGSSSSEAVRLCLKPDEVKRHLMDLYEPGSDLGLPSLPRGSASDPGSGSGKRSMWRSALLKLGRKGSHHS